MENCTRERETEQYTTIIIDLRFGGLKKTPSESTKKFQDELSNFSVGRI